MRTTEFDSGQCQTLVRRKKVKTDANVQVETRLDRNDQLRDADCKNQYEKSFFSTVGKKITNVNNYFSF